MLYWSIKLKYIVHFDVALSWKTSNFGILKYQFNFVYKIIYDKWRQYDKISLLLIIYHIFGISSTLINVK